jgi:hypothetical protein
MKRSTSFFFHLGEACQSFDARFFSIMTDSFMDALSSCTSCAQDWVLLDPECNLEEADLLAATAPRKSSSNNVTLWRTHCARRAPGHSLCTPCTLPASLTDAQSDMHIYIYIHTHTYKHTGTKIRDCPLRSSNCVKHFIHCIQRKLVSGQAKHRTYL